MSQGLSSGIWLIVIDGRIESTVMVMVNYKILILILTRLSSKIRCMARGSKAGPVGGDLRESPYFIVIVIIGTDDH